MTATEVHAAAARQLRAGVPRLEVERELLAQNARLNGRRLPDGDVVAAIDAAERGDNERASTLTDTGNAERLVRLHGERLHFIPAWRRWLVWDATTWRQDPGDVLVTELAKDVGLSLRREAAETVDKTDAKRLFGFGTESLSAGRIGAMVKLARGVPGIPLDHEQLDADPWLLGANNGVVDLRTGQLRKPDPADLMTMQAPVDFDPQAPAPRWERAMGEWFPDPEVRAYVQRLVGASLVGQQAEHVFIIHYGGGSNGKGTFVRALQRALGPYAVTLHLSLIVDQGRSEHDTVKAHLFRARLAVASETERRVRLAEASVKNLSGGDRIIARRMREDSWEFDPTHTLWLQTNHLPEIKGRDAGIWRRIRVVKWVATFQRSKEDLDATLAAEAPGILRWAVDGCLAWQEDGLAEPEAVVRDTIRYRSSEDTFGRFAGDVGLAFGSGHETTAAELLETFDDWAAGEGIVPDNHMHGELNAWLVEHDAQQVRVRRTDVSGKSRRLRQWQGVGFVETPYTDTTT